ncbi:hypothetical protein MSAN_01512800 [Mycena sanguinolenta]|uniref:Protein kinase domain-containing protein n=1 Tax=Mycena sanguinolenta TaxID=230812 RepID=A0A8H6Y353_9AGAR|nr:hypothetical protein MSAN_01512800 [Mycena sanguinolenta]
MDPQVDSDEEFIVLSTSDCAESASYPSPQAGGLKSNAKLFVESFSFLSSRLGARVGTAETHTRKYSETRPGRQAAEQLVKNYNYYIDITGGFGGSGGEGRDQGGDGGTGQGPTVYFGQPEARESSEFQTIRLGDLKLIKEVRLSLQSGVVGCQSRGVGVRRIYHAEIRHDPGTVTIAMYQGDGAEEWRHNVAKYDSIRHPNIMQLYGLVSTERLYAMVFHDELIPYAQFFDCFQHSPILTAYIIGYCPIIKATEHQEATHYVFNVSPKSPKRYNFPGWIRPSTGKLCLDLAQGEPETNLGIFWSNSRILHLDNLSLDAPDSEDMIISSLSEDQYHKLCCESPIAQFHYFQVSTEYPVGVGIFRTDSQYAACVRITEPLQFLLEEELNWYNYGNAPDDLLPNSYDSSQTSSLGLELHVSFSLHELEMAWLAQGNHIFTELEKVTDAEDYVCVYGAEFILRTPYKHDIPEGYLFVCPSQDFRTGNEVHVNLYQWPACPAYWSLDPSGADRLSTEDARNLGFPAIHIETVMEGLSWDRSVYQGLRRFHEGKGFDPNSEEVARWLGYPLYEVSSDPCRFRLVKSSSIRRLAILRIPKFVGNWVISCNIRFHLLSISIGAASPFTLFQHLR